MSMQTPPEGQTTVDRLWSTVASAEVLGGSCLVAGGLLVGAAVSAEGGGWLEPLAAPSILPLAAGLLAIVAIVAVGIVWDRYAETRVADAAGRRRGWVARTLPSVGATALIVGAATLVGSWLAVQAGSPPGRLRLSVGEKAETFESRVAGETIEVMLPMRVHLDGLSLEQGPSVEVSFSQPGEDPFGRRRLRAGETVAMEGYRLAPVGLASEQGKLRATIASTRENTIKAAVSNGDTFKLTPKGPEYRVAEVTKSYMGALGPAVRIENERFGSAWIFGRGADPENFPDFTHDLYIESLQRAPGVAFAVTPDFPLWPIGLGGGLVVCGLALLVAFPERVRRGERLESFNEAGRFVEATTGDEEEA